MSRLPLLHATVHDALARLAADSEPRVRGHLSTHLTSAADRAAGSADHVLADVAHVTAQYQSQIEALDREQNALLEKLTDAHQTLVADCARINTLMCASVDRVRTMVDQVERFQSDSVTTWTDLAATIDAKAAATTSTWTDACTKAETELGKSIRQWTAQIQAILQDDEDDQDEDDGDHEE
ncbi:hypothetical protein BC828DRAFT_407107 [Blastocladiella britannica]|nr:hypothetical protein BC828DRAFT_407107 [Blastocladiella britannica]